jgi:hypothetical protein
MFKSDSRLLFRYFFVNTDHSPDVALCNAINVISSNLPIAD